ncbi:MAG: type I phosphomannose isomerase catalytic subunit [Chthoniobacterales bacterium]
MSKVTTSHSLLPLTFVPLFKKRIWGGRRLEELFGKKLPANERIGESWEIVDRPEAQSVVRDGTWQGRTVHELWREERGDIFGDIADAPRFPLFVKLLDAAEKLSVQVHPPAALADSLGGEPKTEFWYIAAAQPGAELYVGLRNESTRDDFEAALANGTVDQHLHRISVRTGDAMFLPSGRVHAIGGGNVIVEIQQNSDTTYRVFDWNRTGEDGQPRALHVSESLQSIDFSDYEPALAGAEGETLVRHPLFAVEKWELTAPRPVSPAGTFAIVGCLSGEVRCAGVRLRAGEFFLVPACLRERDLAPGATDTSLLRVSLPQT